MKSCSRVEVQARKNAGNAGKETVIGRTTDKGDMGRGKKQWLAPRFLTFGAK